MNKDEIYEEFKKVGALLEGHFVLSSGLHSSVYLQCAKVMMHAQLAEKFCRVLVDQIQANYLDDPFDCVVSPALGGVLVGYEIGRQLRIPSIFTERVDGSFELRRGFGFLPNSKILLIEDVITTGKSSLECIECIKKNKGKVKAIGCLIDRTDGKVNFSIPFFSLMSLSIPVFSSEALPEDLAKIPIQKPGSRDLVK
tara:strand:- start:703 stop:1293 length:591 start_codon:yes stop_codon:yes gene_type:complete